MESHQVLSENIDENYRQFFNDAVNTGCVWGLESNEGWAQCASEKSPELSVIPFWSQPEYLDAHKNDEWSDYKAVAISLEEFLDEWLTGMHEDVLLLGINWNEELEGKEHEPLDILYEFEQALSS